MPFVFEESLKHSNTVLSSPQLFNTVCFLPCKPFSWWQLLSEDDKVPLVNSTSTEFLWIAANRMKKVSNDILLRCQKTANPIPLGKLHFKITVSHMKDRNRKNNPPINLSLLSRPYFGDGGYQTQHHPCLYMAVKHNAEFSWTGLFVEDAEVETECHRYVCALRVCLGYGHDQVWILAFWSRLQQLCSLLFLESCNKKLGEWNGKKLSRVPSEMLSVS